ncbi:YjdJ family protein [Fictibacillus halophilus]|uniref:YjdJ family protein n=1 Tax=Fictibacillus halophilus TaxID=1610490 RepID=UPI001CFAFA82|nr:YjdJ family protein [Fictibacillus halophilus]
MTYIVQYAIAIFTFLFSTFSAWYEGSELRNVQWEWNHTAIFSRWMNGTVTAPSDISGLDHFIYAAKFKPVFPMLMAVSGLYIMILTATWLLKNQRNKLFMFFRILGLLLIFTSLLTYQSPTKGLELFTLLFIVTGLMSIMASAVIKVKLPIKENIY